MPKSEAKAAHFTSRWLRWANPARPGSRGWFWQMRLLNIHIWLTPPVILTVALFEYQAPGGARDAALNDRLMFSLPWVAVTVGASALAYALWRIEVNMEGDRRPFTEKDEKIYQQALGVQAVAASTVLLAFIIRLFYILFHGLGAHVDPDAVSDQVSSLFVAAYPAVGAVYLVGMFTRTLKRTHAKARAYYEELEKGV